ncbi:MAG: hypothetical protein GX444_00955 [Myxococcales bacterium]|nr:hypothetical protein [Myxococcales bacterium]
MAKKELGKFHVCAHCGVKFFDLAKDPPTCPKCGTVASMQIIVRHDDRPAPTAKSKDPDFLEDIGDLEDLDGDYDGEFDTELDGDFSTSSTTEEDFTEEEEDI